ncbi:MATE family efflux transporter [Paenibacillus massiliensis]|uniref:MATE family efflux transporter n=1 Tax=Paenibacillus massiliensis TaxID=225917 RepID=UPI0004215776|nr:MATE family efflux transporter [Paenibacillus massiliensis]
MTAKAAQPGSAASGSNQLNIVHLTWPIFLELFLFMLMGSVDTFMLSSVSDNAVSGVGASNQILSIAILILEVIGHGAAIVVAQYIGSKKLLEAARVTGTAITLNLIVGLILSVIFLVFGTHMLQLLNVQGEILVYAKSYMSIVGGAIFLQALINALAATIRTYGFTKETMYISVFMNVIHVVGNYILIFGHFGAPALGVEGAAISTVGSRFISLLIFFWLLYRVTPVRIQIEHYLKLSKDYIVKILQIGIPSAMESIMYQCCQLVFTLYVTYLGAEAMATRQYAVNISSYIYLFSMAVGMGTAIIVGRLVGARQPDSAYTRVLTSVKWALVVTLAIDALVILFRVPLMGIFTTNEEIIRLGAQVLLLSIILESGRTTNIVIINSLRAAGDARFPVYMGILSMVCMSLPLGYLLVFQLDMGLAGIWLAIAADEWTRAIIMYFRWKSRLWEKHALVEPEKEEPVPAPAAAL